MREKIIIKLKKDGIYILCYLFAIGMFAGTYFFRTEKRTMKLDTYYLFSGIIMFFSFFWRCLRAVNMYKEVKTDENKNKLQNKVFSSVFLYVLYLINVDIYIMSTKILY